MTSDEKYVCNYALLRFLPYPETGEFVNLGVVAHCAEAGVFVSRLESSNVKRIADFFPEFDLEQFYWARDMMFAEVHRVQDLYAERKRLSTLGDDQGRTLFLQLVRPRESLFRFGEIRTILTADPQRVADRLFEQYVMRTQSVDAAARPAALAG